MKPDITLLTEKLHIPLEMIIKTSKQHIALHTIKKRIQLLHRSIFVQINYGSNKELMKRCRPLSDYSNFISNVRLFKVKGKEMADAVHLAINELGDDSPIKDYLQMMEAEVLKSCITEYDEQKVMDKFREEYIAEGLQKGLQEGLQKGLSDGRTEQAKFTNDQLKTLGMDISQRSKVLGLPEQQLRKWDKEV